jgi:GAF domain-containing protein
MTNQEDYFKIFCKISQAFGTAASKEELLDLVCQSAIDTMDGKASCLFLADERQDVFVPVAQKGLSEDYLHASPMKARRLVQAIVKEGYLSFRDATTDERLENHDKKIAEGIASILSVPVMVKGKVRGVLSLYTAEHRDFRREEIEFLSALADQGGVAIRQASLLDRISSTALLFLDLTSAINSSLDIRDILNNLTVEVCRSLDMKGATIRLLNEDTGALELVASHGVSEDFLEKGPAFFEESAAEALKGETMIIGDAAEDERISYGDALKEEGIRSMIVTPIKSRDLTIGVFRLFGAEPRHFPESTVALVKALAHQGALAIQNASMYLKLQEDKKSLEEDIWSHRSWF